MSDPDSLVPFIGDSELAAAIRQTLEELDSETAQQIFAESPEDIQNSEPLGETEKQEVSQDLGESEQNDVELDSSAINSVTQVDIKEDIRKTVLEFRGILDIYTESAENKDKASLDGLLQDIREFSPVTKILTSINRNLADFKIEELKSAEFWIMEGCNVITRLMKTRLENPIISETEETVQNFVSVSLDDFDVFCEDGKMIISSCLSILGQHFKTGKMLLENVLGMLKQITSSLSERKDFEGFVVKLFEDVNHLFIMIWSKFSDALQTKSRQTDSKSKKRGKSRQADSFNKIMSLREAVDLQEKDIPGYLAALKSCMYGLADYPEVRSSLMENYNCMLTFLNMIKS